MFQEQIQYINMVYRASALLKENLNLNYNAY